MNGIGVADNTPREGRILHAVVRNSRNKIVTECVVGTDISRAFKVNQTVVKPIALLPSGVVNVNAAFRRTNVLQQRVGRRRITPLVLSEVGVGLNRHIRVHHRSRYGDTGNCSSKECHQRDGGTTRKTRLVSAFHKKKQSFEPLNRMRQLFAKKSYHSPAIRYFKRNFFTS